MGLTIESSIEVAEEFNDYFSSVFTNKNTDCMPEPCAVCSGGSDNQIDNLEITMEDVAKKLGRLREDKASGADDLSPRLLFNIRSAASCASHCI